MIELEGDSEVTIREEIFACTNKFKYICLFMEIYGDVTHQYKQGGLSGERSP